MCNSLIIHTKDKHIVAENQGELIKAIGCSINELESEDCYGRDALREDGCLCPIDMKMTAKRHGYRHENTCEGEFDPFNFHWYKEGL